MCRPGPGKRRTNALCAAGMGRSGIDQRKLRRAVRELAAADADLARIGRLHGPPGLRAREPGFPTLLNIMVSQQLSRASAEAIWGRLEAACRPLSAARFLTLSDEAVRATGLSRQKAGHARAMARALADGRVELARLASLDDRAAAAALVTLKGIGPWSAEIYLLSALGRPDVWPADDLALMVAVQRLKRLAERPTRPEMERIAEPWRPWRAVAARMLWHYYRHGETADRRREEAGRCGT